MGKKYGLYINGQYLHTGSYGEGPLGQHALIRKDSDPEILEACLEGAHLSFEQLRTQGLFPVEQRIAFLKRFKERLQDQKENIARVMCEEIYKPISLCKSEVDRGLQTTQASIEALENFFEPKNISANPKVLALRVPKGPVLAISPFNFPLNLVLHKILPAIASGCPVILKPSPKAYITALCVADFCHAEGLPAGFLQAIQCENEITSQLIADPRVAHVSFTGSAPVGWSLKKLHPEKDFTLELGGAAPVFIDEGVDLEKTATQVLRGAFSYAGQVCISVQSIHVHKNIYSQFKEVLKKRFLELPIGDHTREDVYCSRVIDENSYKRISELLNNLKNAGAQEILPRQEQPAHIENFLSPQIFEQIPMDHDFIQEEVFAPLASIHSWDSFDMWIPFANSLKSRLQVGVFTEDPKKISKAQSLLDFGGVIVNESSALRIDAMPYGGNGRAGIGREGPAFAMESFCQWKSLIDCS